MKVIEPGRQIQYLYCMSSLLFKTNVKHHYDVITLRGLLQKEFPSATVQFDLTTDPVRLRMDGSNVPVSRVIQLIKHAGYYCELLEEKIQ